MRREMQGIARLAMSIVMSSQSCQVALRHFVLGMVATSRVTPVKSIRAGVRSVLLRPAKPVAKCDVEPIQVALRHVKSSIVQPVRSCYGMMRTAESAGFSFVVLCQSSQVRLELCNAPNGCVPPVWFGFEQSHYVRCRPASRVGLFWVMLGCGTPVESGWSTPCIVRFVGSVVLILVRFRYGESGLASNVSVGRD